MRYENAELRERLAAEYVLGTMPRLARRRFARLIADDPGLARLVADWMERFAPIDADTAAVEPPARVRHAVERRISARSPAVLRSWRWRDSIAFWRGATLVAAAAAAALVLYVAASPGPPAPRVVAILSDNGGAPVFVALGRPTPLQISIAAVRPLAEDTAHSYELWAIAGGSPRSLGLLHPRADRPLMLQAALLPPVGGTLAVSLEPPGGSPSGLPTGPVLYKGDVLASPP